MAEERVDVVVVGAGAAGLAAAEVLARAGIERPASSRPARASAAAWTPAASRAGRCRSSWERSSSRERRGALLARARKAASAGQADRAAAPHARGWPAGGCRARSWRRRSAQVAALHGDVPVDEALEAQARAGELDAGERALARHYVEGYYAADAIAGQRRGDRARSSGPRARCTATRPRGSRAATSASSSGSSASVQKRAPGRAPAVDRGHRDPLVGRPGRWWSRGRAPAPAPGTPARPGRPSSPSRSGVLRAPAGRDGRHPLRAARARRGARGGGARARAAVQAAAPLPRGLLALGHAHRAPCAPRGFGFAHLPGGPVPTWWTTAPVESGVLTGWAGGPLAQELSALPPDVAARPRAGQPRAAVRDSAARLGGAARRRGPATTGRPTRSPAAVTP